MRTLSLLSLLLPLTAACGSAVEDDLLDPAPPTETPTPKEFDRVSFTLKIFSDDAATRAQVASAAIDVYVPTTGKVVTCESLENGTRFEVGPVNLGFVDTFTGRRVELDDVPTSPGSAVVVRVHDGLDASGAVLAQGCRGELEIDAGSVVSVVLF